MRYADSLLLGLLILMASFTAGRGQLPPSPITPPTANRAGMQPRDEPLPTSCDWNSGARSRGFSARNWLEYFEKYLQLCREAGDQNAVVAILTSTGNRLMNAGQPERAVAAWEDAVRLSISINDTRNLIGLSITIGQTYNFNLRNRPKAREYLEKALSLSRVQGEKQQISLALGALAFFESMGGDRNKATGYADEALRIVEETGDRRAIAQRLTLSASTYSIVRDLGKALELYHRGLKLYQEIGDLTNIASTLDSIGGIYQRQGFHFYASDYFERSLKVFENSGNTARIMNSLDKIAANYENLGDRAKALESWKRLLKIQELTLSGEVTELCKPPECRPLIIQSGISERAWESRIAQTHTAIAQLYSKVSVQPGVLIDLSDAVRHYEHALKIHEKHRNNRSIIAVHWALGEMHKDVRRYTQAIEYFQKSLPYCENENGRFSTWAMRPLTRIAYISGLQKNFAVGIEFAERASLLSARLEEPGSYSPFDSFWMLGAAYVELGEFEKAKSALEKAFTISEANAARLATEEERMRLFTTLQSLYSLYIESVMQLHKKDPKRGLDRVGLATAERARARNFLESLSLEETEIDQGMDPLLLSKQKDLEQRLNEAAARQERVRFDQNSWKGARREIEGLRSELLILKEKIDMSSPRYAALARPQTLGVDEIQRDLLDKETVLLEYNFGQGHTHLWLLGNSSFQSFMLPNRGVVESEARALFRLLTDGSRWTKDPEIASEYARVSQIVSNTLLGSVAEQIKGKRLIIVADGALQYIPFGALPPPGNSASLVEPTEKRQLLAATNEIISLPSASVLSVLRREAGKRKKAGQGIAVVADPVFSENDERLAGNQTSATKSEAPKKPNLTRLMLERAFAGTSGSVSSIPRLPFTRDEAESIFAASPKRSSYKALDFEADRVSLLKHDLLKYRIVHFATHGILHTEHPDLSGIVLSLVNKKGEPVNGFLRLNEIYNMKLNADLVVLSACQTALGKEVRGEGLIGLTRGFMYAGTSRVVASLWKVDDVATAELMKIFYQKMLKEKMRPAAALRAAKIAMMKQKRWSSPYYWAAFELQGDWR